jgi:hypothetical protein
LDAVAGGSKVNDGWINCKDRLPAIELEVLIFGKVGYNHFKKDDRKWKMFVGYLNSHAYGEHGTWRLECECSGYDFDREVFEAFYWMPLPEPPGQKVSSVGEAVKPVDNTIDLTNMGMCGDCKTKLMAAFIKQFVGLEKC